MLFRSTELVPIAEQHTKRVLGKTEFSEPKTEAEFSANKKHGVEKIEGKNREWWAKQNITVIKQQAEFRGHRLTDFETKGGSKKEHGLITKFKKFKKADYLEVLNKILKIEVSNEVRLDNISNNINHYNENSKK